MAEEKIETEVYSGCIYKVYIDSISSTDCYYVKTPKSSSIINGFLLYECYLYPFCSRFIIATASDLCEINRVVKIELVAKFEEEWFLDCIACGKYKAIPSNGEYYIDIDDKSYRLARAIKGTPIWEDWVEDIIPYLKSNIKVELIGNGPNLPTIGFLKDKCIRSL